MSARRQNSVAHDSSDQGTELHGESTRVLSAWRTRLPVILQSESTECGLACLAMVASYFGARTDLAGLRRDHAVSLRGAGLSQLMDVAARLRLAARPLRLELDELHALRTPAVLHWDLDHFVVLKKARKNTVEVHNPALGLRRYSLQETSRHFTGVAIEFQPVEGFEAVDRRVGLRIGDFWQRSTGLWQGLGHVLVLSLLLQLFALAAPFYVQLVVDEGIAKGDAHLVSVLALGFLLLVGMRVAVNALRGIVMLQLGGQLGLQMASNLLHHLLRLPVVWFEKRQLGDILSRFSSLKPVNALFSEGIVGALVDGVMALTTLCMMLLYDTRLSWVVLSAVVAYACVRIAMYPGLHRRTEECLQAGAREEGHFIESVRAVRTIKVFGQERTRHAQWLNRQTELVQRNLSVGMFGVGYGAAQALLAGIENVAVVYLGAQAVLAQQLTIGMLYAFIAYKTQFSERMTALIDRMFEVRMLKVHLDRLADIVLTAPESAPAQRILLRPLGGDLALEDVAFSFSPLDPWLFSGVSLQLRAGESVAIVGPSGCGKSTLLKLLMSLLAPTEGHVRVDGRLLEAAMLPDYRQRIGSVLQDDQLLTGSIADNICFFDLTPDYEWLQRCAELACIDGDIRSMPMGYASLVGDLGAGLSAGQRQRLLLARALYRRPAVLLLDEITANLDPATAERVRTHLAAQSMTRIYVTHDPLLAASAQRCLQLTSTGLRPLQFPVPMETAAAVETAAPVAQSDETPEFQQERTQQGG